MNTLILSIYQLFGVNSREQFADLVSAKGHQEIIRQHRAELIASRIFPFAVLFGILVPAWGVLDLIFFPAEIALAFLAMRLVSGGAFFALAYITRKLRIGMKRALSCLMAMLMIPTLFFQFSSPMIEAVELTGMAVTLMHLYGLLPYVVIASLALFPLTLKEFSLFALVLVALASFGLYNSESSDLNMLLVQLWLLLVILGVSMFSSLQQVRYLISQMVKASYDGLTKLLTRRAGMDILESLFRATGLQQSNFHCFLSIWISSKLLTIPSAMMPVMKCCDKLRSHSVKAYDGVTRQSVGEEKSFWYCYLIQTQRPLKLW